MGSAITTVGNRGGKLLYTFTAANQDSGVILSVAPSATCVGDLPVGYKNALFQLIGTNSAGGVLMCGTIDLQTARGLAAEWVPLPAPSTEASYQWANPLSKSSVGQAILYCSAPFIAYRALSSADFVGSAALLGFVVP